ncbi:hypothetical protein JW905_10975 [bacterium]|nr:hypothetical protein [candidate division CSSED10-310 bacterium]
MSTDDTLITLVFLFIIGAGTVQIVKWLWAARRILAAITFFTLAFVVFFVWMGVQQVEPRIGIPVGLLGCVVAAWRFTRRRMDRY